MDTKSLKEFGKVGVMFILTLLCIITNAAVWNCATEGAASADNFIVVVSILNFLAEAFGIYKLGKKWFTVK